jgi:serine/threonine protein kinase
MDTPSCRRCGQPLESVGEARAEAVTDRADIYSFGITLFEMLASHLPVAQDLFPLPGASEASLASLPASTPAHVAGCDPGLAGGSNSLPANRRCR